MYKAKQAARICTKNLARAGTLNLIFHIYSNSVIISTITINVHHDKNHSINLLVHISGKNKETIIRKIKYTMIHCIVGTGFLVHFKSFQGLSKIFNFWKSFLQHHDKKVTSASMHKHIHRDFILYLVI